jgi:hypothetical protein
MDSAAKTPYSCNYRAYCRDNRESPIQYANLNTEKYHDAKMYNISEGGMYFESSQNSLRRGSEVHIRVTDYSPDIYGPSARDGYRAEVMWCRKILKEGAQSCYGVGVRFMVNTCDHCGGTFSYSEIHRTDDFLFLCPDCLTRLRTLPDGKLRGTIENYLMGNVL